MAMSWLKSSGSCIQLLTIGTNLVVFPLDTRSSAFLRGSVRSQRAMKDQARTRAFPRSSLVTAVLVSPMMVGVGYVQREFCDGQSLASPGRWPPGSRVYPSSPAWSSVRDCFWRFTAHYGTEKLLVDLAMGKGRGISFPV